MAVDATMIRLLIPVVILQLVLLVVALLDLRKRERVLGNSKVLWGAVIVLFQVFGPLLYFVLGRKED